VPRAKLQRFRDATSLLPGDVTPAAGENAIYRGASLDGRGVVFTIGKTLYLRRDNAKTYEIGEDLEYAGIAEGGGRVFYMKGSDLYAYDAEAEASVRFTESGDVTPVNVAAEGTAAYFLSPSVLSAEANPNGALPQPGGENLYLSREGTLHFLGTVSEEDIDAEGEQGKDPVIPGLGRWLHALRFSSGELGLDPSRATPDGQVLLFESRADLTGYDHEGYTEVYRYDALANTLTCLSCNPTLVAPSGNGRLNLVSRGGGGPLGPSSLTGNLRDDGRRAFFESEEALVAADTDGLSDVYEWEDEGVGSCRTEGGCVYLISSGQSAHPNYLFGVSEDGRDVFFRTTDLLLPEHDPDETASIYDARVEGGFAPPSGNAGECLGEACQPAVVAPEDPTPVSASFEGQGNVFEAPSANGGCAKHKVRRHGRCVARKRHRKAKKHSARAAKHRGRAGNYGRAGR
jgi:hypothetical protein